MTYKVCGAPSQHFEPFRDGPGYPHECVVCESGTFNADRLCDKCSEFYEGWAREIEQGLEMDWGNTTRDDAGFTQPPHL